MPLCTCDGRLRPDVVWFGEMLPEDALDSAYSAAEVAELFLSVGTSAVVHPAASLPEIAKSKGAFLIEINVEPTVLTPMADLFLEGLSGKILPELFAEWMSERAKAE
jgi:NAD-dependent deacetylase